MERPKNTNNNDYEMILNDVELNSNNEEMDMNNEPMHMNIDKMPMNNEDMPMNNEEMSMNNEEMPMNNEEMSMSNKEMHVDNEEVHVDNEEIHANNEEIDNNNQDLTSAYVADNNNSGMLNNEGLNSSESQENEVQNDEGITANYEARDEDAENDNASNVFAEVPLDVSVSMAGGSEVLADSYNLNSCSEQSDATTETEGYTGRISNSSKLVVPGMLSLVATERRCCICGGKGRSRVPLTVAVDTWMTKQVFIPPKLNLALQKPTRVGKLHCFVEL